jgi:catechol 2,3-dioxygenase-like lactoylglutathione lyase family enzyme
MLSQSTLTTSAPIADIDKSRQFYRDKLGLKEIFADEAGILFEAGSGSSIYLYKRGPTTANHTIASFTVKDIVAEVTDLKSRGVVMEDYDLPGIKTIDGIATWGEDRAAWFKDPDNNILGLFQKG